jgi:D-alanine-D-alanine ligase
MKNIAVFFGGKSTEREISILTGLLVLRLIDREKYAPTPVYIHTDGEFYSTQNGLDLNDFKTLKIERFDKVFFVKNELFKIAKTTKRQTALKPYERIDCAINCCHGGWGEGGACPR